METLGIGYALFKRVHDYPDKIVEENKTIKTLKKDVDKYFLSRSYADELNRILNGKKQREFIGHPAHYIIQNRNFEQRKIMIRDVISALYNKGRLISKRYTIVDITNYGCSTDILENYFKINVGATVVIKICDDEEKTDVRRRVMDIEDVCTVVKANCTKTLTIFSVDSYSTNIKETITRELLGISLVTLSSPVFYKESAAQTFAKLAERDKLPIDKETQNKFLNSDKTYDIDGISLIYNKWRHKYLTTKLFPEYSEFVIDEESAEVERISDSAYNQLQRMIGLTEAKKVIDDALNYFKMKKEMTRRGLKSTRPAMHMVFTGSPGTAKTSVARLVARILKENDILENGELIEVGRADLIGEYVGQTAPKVRTAFARAKGSVLFIDEAYSLLDDRRGLYGDEAINTIVQEMENRRDDTVVIFAGYKDEMESFLNRNPGLSSRIAFKIPFEDYSETELLDIIRLLAKEKDLVIDSEADEKLLDIFKTARRNANFGNGRFARNLLENAALRQASRISKEDADFVSDEEILTLRAEDFYYKAEKQTFKIGFYTGN